MSLPFSTEYPSVPIRMITPEEVNLQIPLPSDLPGWTDNESARVVAVLRNTASEAAFNNAARMFCYNLLMDNGCNNTFFQEVLSMVFTRIKQIHSKSPNQDVYTLIKQSVVFVLTCVTAMLPYQYEKLKSLVDYRFLKDGEKLVSEYDNLKRGSSGMSFFSNQQQIMVQVNVANGPDGAPYLVVRSNVGFDNNYRVNQTAQGYFIQVGTMTIPVAMTNMGVQVVYKNIQGSAEEFFRDIVIPEAMATQQQRQAGFGNMGGFNQQQNNSWGNQPQQQTSMPASIFPSSTPVNAVVQQDTGEMSVLARKAAEITRSQVLNQTAMGGVRQDFMPQQQQMTQAAPAADISEGITMSMTQQKPAFEPFTEETADTFVRQVQGRDLAVYGEEFVVESVTLACQRVLAEGLLKGSGVSRRFGAVYQQFPTTMEKVDDYINRLTGVGNIGDLGVRIKSLIESVNRNIDNRTEVDQLRSLRAGLMGINRLLTVMVNNFINYALASAKDSKLKTSRDEAGVPKPIFDSFCEDISDVCTLLDRRLDNNAKQIWREFQKNLMAGLAAYDPNIQANYQADATEGIKYLCLPYGVSVTYVNALSVDLGFKETRAVIVDGSVSPAILTVCNSLNRSKAMISETAVDYLVTMDGKIFTIYQNSDDKWVLVEKN